MTPTLSGKRRPTELVSVQVLNKISEALKTVDSITLSADQKAALKDMQVHDCVDRTTFCPADRPGIVTVSRGEHGKGFDWRCD